MSDSPENMPGPEFTNPIRPSQDNELMQSRRVNFANPPGGSSPDRIPGIDPNETWASWMLSSKAEYNSLANVEAQTLARRIASRPDSVNSAERLSREYLSLEQQVAEKKIGQADGEFLMAKIAERIEELETRGSSNRQSGIEMGILEELQRLREETLQMRLAMSAMGERTNPFVERDRWVQMEYDQEFYTQFDPRSEPTYFKNIEDKRERKVWQSRWRLARIAYVKKQTNAFPDQLSKGPEIGLLTNEMIWNMLENVEGSKEMVETYIGEILNKDSEFWQLIKAEKMNTNRFDVYRQQMRERIRKEVIIRSSDLRDVVDMLDDRTRQEVLNDVATNHEHAKVSEVLKQLNVKQIKKIADKLNPQDVEELSRLMPETIGLPQGTTTEQRVDLKLLEADAVAWNVIYISNLVEWANSKYTIAGDRYELPLAIASDDYTAVYHQDEKLKSKILAGHTNYNTLTPWGIEQVARAKSRVSFNNDTDIIEFESARNEGEYWIPKRTRETKNGKTIIKIKAPEIAPTSIATSFLHKTKVVVADRSGWKINLEGFRTYIPETDETGEENPYGAWVVGNFNKAVKLKGIFDGSERETEINPTPRPGETYKMAETFSRIWLDLMVRLRPEERMKELRDKGLSHQEIEKFTEFALYASSGGMDDIEDPRPTTKLRDWAARSAFVSRLKKFGVQIGSLRRSPRIFR